MLRIRSQSGQAAVELAAAIPLVLVTTLAVAQLALIGFALWAGAGAARAGARAALVGEDGKQAAESAVPSPFDAAADVKGSRVSLRVRAPSLLPGIRMPTVSTSAKLDPSTVEASR